MSAAVLERVRQHSDHVHHGQAEPTPASLDLRLTTFNILAPCYKRLNPGVLPPSVSEQTVPSSFGSRPRESDYGELWRQRAGRTADFIAGEIPPADIVCLQEYWFNDDFQQLYAKRFNSDYEIYHHQRTGHKADGIAILLRRDKFLVLGQEKVALGSVGNRVGMLLHIRVLDDSAATPREFVLMNTHLTFPHNLFDRRNQMSQIHVVTETLDGYVTKRGLPENIPRVLTGDLNVEDHDPVCGHLHKEGYRSAMSLYNREQRASPPRRMVSHLNHRGEQVMVDHVFVKADPHWPGGSVGEASASHLGDITARLKDDVRVHAAVLLPADLDDSTWADEFDLSDHRPLSVHLSFFMD